MGIAGIIVWGSNGDVRTGTNDCDVLGTYINTTLGPFLQRLTSSYQTALLNETLAENKR